MKKLIDEYKKLRPDAFLIDLVGEIQQQGWKNNEVRLPQIDFETLTRFFDNPETAARMETYGITKFDADFVDKPEYAFCDGIAILPA